MCKQAWAACDMSRECHVVPAAVSVGSRPEADIDWGGQGEVRGLQGSNARDHALV